MRFASSMLRAVVAFLILEASAVRVSRPSTIKKVVLLLETMKDEIRAEQKHGEDVFEKSSCFCRSQRESLSEAINRAEKQLPILQSEAKSMDASIFSLEAELKRDSQDQSEATAGEDQAQQIRKDSSKENKAKIAELSKNLYAVQEAIGLIRSGASFLQMPTVELEQVVEENFGLEDSRRQQMLSFLEGSSAPSSLVLGTLESLETSMRQEYDRAVKAESLAAKGFTGLIRSKRSEGQSLREQIAQKTERLGDLKLEVVQKRRDTEEMAAEKAENAKLLSDLKETCHNKTIEHDQRVAVQNDELSAISEVLQLLDTDGQQSPQGLSFLQLRDVRTEVNKRLSEIQRVPPSLQFVMLALKGKKIGLEEVVKIIDSMMETLQEEQKSEEKKKQNCREQYRSLALKERQLSSQRDDAEIQIRDVQERFNLIQEDLKRMERGIQDLDRSVSEATEIRKAEQGSYQHLERTSLETKDLLEKATRRLQDVFSKPRGSFLEEVSRHFHRQLSDDASLSASTTSLGSKASGVLALLHQIIHDVGNELAQAQKAEENAETEYRRFMKDAGQKRSDDMYAFLQKQTFKASVEAELLSFKNLRVKTQNEQDVSQEYRLALKKDCEWLLKNWDDRVDARDREMQALRDAKATLAAEDGG